MKTPLARVIVYGLLLAILASYCAVQAQSPTRKAINPAVQNTRILDAINDRQNLLRATREPFVVAPPKASACAMFGGFSEKSNPHDGFAVHVYFEKAGRDMMTTGKGTYPVNSLIIKEKLRSSKTTPPVPEKLSANAKPDQEKYSTELFTGMLKREAGYNPECGDWEFFIVDGAANNMLARGKIDSCMACHQFYKTTDYVTREYMPAAK